MAAGVEWNDVWAEYDSRQPKRPLPPRPSMAPPPPASARAPARGFSAAWAALTLLPTLLVGWVGAPYGTAWRLAEALEGRDEAGLSRHIDLVALQADLREALTLGPSAPQGEQASAFLGAMAEEMAAAWTRPAALAEVARARGVPPGAAADALRRTMPVGLTRFEMPLHGTAAPMTLRLELKGEGLAPRWQVTGLRLSPTAPAAAPGPALRLSAIR